MNIMISEEDWKAIQETLYLVSIPGMRESIHEGLATQVDECEKEPGW
jgi:PHD/YefM family antitoxin component YafN of YafNO toxin-antitoxin module